MKLTVVGGGSTYTPELIDGFARLRDNLPVEDGGPATQEGGDDLAGQGAAGVRRVPRPRGQRERVDLAADRRVDQDEVLDGQGVPQAGEAVDEFGGVGRPSADHGEFHTSFNPSLRST